MKNVVLENILGRFVLAHYDFMEDGSVSAALDTEYGETLSEQEFEVWMLDLMSTCIKEDIEILDYPLLSDCGTIFNNKPVTRRCLEFATNAGGDIAKCYFLYVPPVISENYIGSWKVGNGIENRDNRYDTRPTNRVIFKEPKVSRFNRASTIRHSVEMSLRCGCFI